MHLQENTLFDLDVGVKVTHKVAQYPLHYVTYTPEKFVVATSNGLGEDIITRKMRDTLTDRWYEINIQLFSLEKKQVK